VGATPGRNVRRKVVTQLPETERVILDELSTPVSHYAHAVRAGNLVFISGVVATDKEGNVVGPGDPVAQTRQIFRNIQLLLDRFQAGPQHIVKVTVYLRNMEDRPRVNTVREEYFGVHRPASTLVEITKLIDPALLVEIDATAVL